MLSKADYAIRTKVAQKIKALFPEIIKAPGIYIWQRKNGEGVECCYIGKAKNLLERTVGHICTKNKLHLDKSIVKHGLKDTSNPDGWTVRVLCYCETSNLDELEQRWLLFYRHEYPDWNFYNIESGGTVGKSIIGERKARRDLGWRKTAREKAFAELSKWFTLCSRENATKKDGKLYAEAEKLKEEFENAK